MDLNLAGKVAVVTGASKGIGLAITRALVAEGASVVAGARSITDELVALSDTGQVLAVSVDLSGPDAPAELVARAAHFGGLDIVVNNVGAVTPRTTGFLNVTRRRLARHVQSHADGGRAHHASGHPAAHRARRRQRGDHLLGQRLPAGSRRDRLRGGQGRGVEPVQVALEGVRRTGSALQHHQPRAGVDAPLARRERCGGNRCQEPWCFLRRSQAPDHRGRRAAFPPVASRSPRKSQTSSSSSRASARATSPAPTSSSMAASPKSSSHHTRIATKGITACRKPRLYSFTVSGSTRPRGRRGSTSSPSTATLPARRVGPVTRTRSRPRALPQTRLTTSASSRSATTTPTTSRRSRPSRSSLATPSADSSPRSCSRTTSRSPRWPSIPRRSRA